MVQITCYSVGSKGASAISSFLAADSTYAAVKKKLFVQAVHIAWPTHKNPGVVPCFPLHLKTLQTPLSELSHDDKDDSTRKKVEGKLQQLINGAHKTPFCNKSFLLLQLHTYLQWYSTVSVAVESY